MRWVMEKRNHYNLIKLTVVIFLTTMGFSYSAHAKHVSIPVSYNSESSFISKAEKSGDPYYQFMQGVDAYEATDFKSAAEIFMELAKSGYVSAQYQLAVMLDSGLGFQEDHAQSAIWYQKAARKGHVEAQYNLAIAYATGEGIRHDMQKSIYWMKKSALDGNINAQYNLGLIYIMGNGVNVNFEEGMLWWKLAAKNGDGMAQYNLGLMYLEGKGVTSDACEASRWWQVSAENGFIQSLIALQNLKASKLQAHCQDMVSRN